MTAPHHHLAPSRRWRLRAAGAAAALAATLLAACGGGGSMSTPTVSACAGGCSSALITLQDAAGDFQSYTVDVASIQLKKANGAVVETLPATTRIDFAQLVTLAELFNAGQIPLGDYVSASVTLDFSNASIIVDDGAGGTKSLSPVDATGAAITGQVTLSVQLDNANHLVISTGHLARLALDFNLAASNTVNLAAGTVTVNPVIQADLAPPSTLQVRVRGTYVSADTAANTYVANVHPFHSTPPAMATTTPSTEGQVTVHVTDTTTYEIDGTPYTGAAGLAKLAQEAVGTITAAFGTVDTSTKVFTATRVLAGTSVESNTMDRITGVVTARTGDVLTVSAGDLDMHDHSFRFMRGPVTVNLGTGTTVTKEGDGTTHAIGDISVGQRISAAGTATVDATAGTATFDATAGSVRLALTSLWGTVTGTVASPLTLQLQAIEGRDASKFNFAGTGTTPATDATAAAYLADTGTLSLAQLQVGKPTRLFGFVVPFGSATTADFKATTLVSYAQVESMLAVNWASPGSLTAFPGLTSGSSSISLDLTGVGMVHVLRTGPQSVNLLSLATPPQVVGSTTATNVGFAIGHQHSHTVDNYHAFADFVAALAADLNGTTKVLGIVASGQVDSAGNTLAADHAAVTLSD